VNPKPGVLVIAKLERIYPNNYGGPSSVDFEVLGKVKLDRPLPGEDKKP
jgi:hypothetical protein